MTEAQAVAATGRSAGALLRAAREQQNMHIETLAAAIKVPPAKLRALEADQYDQLPDMAFGRALAKTVCRSLRIDAEPVLALLPQPRQDGAALQQVSNGLAAPFRERAPGRESGEPALLSKPLAWGALLVLLAALVVYLLPQEWLQRRTTTSEVVTPAANEPGIAQTTPAPAAAASVPPPALADAAAAAPAGPGAALVDVVSPSPDVSADAQGSAAAGAAATAAAPVGEAAGILKLRTTAPSWVEVVDGSGKVLLSRTLQPGETVGLDGTLPLRLKVGNAAVTEATFRGETIDVAGSTRDNVARLELK